MCLLLLILDDKAAAGVALHSAAAVELVWLYVGGVLVA
jgi:hypothetical protein